MGIYNSIHDPFDEKFYYCADSDCCCHLAGYWGDSSDRSVTQLRSLPIVSEGIPEA